MRSVVKHRSQLAQLLKRRAFYPTGGRLNPSCWGSREVVGSLSTSGRPMCEGLLHLGPWLQLAPFKDFFKHCIAKLAFSKRVETL
eukprot:scaffold29411_cov32-Prasinocladus_malaysianus.AAC.1